MPTRFLDTLYLTQRIKFHNISIIIWEHISFRLFHVKIIFDNIINVSDYWTIIINMGSKIRYFTRWKNRSKDLSSNSFFSKELASNPFTKTGCCTRFYSIFSQSNQRVMCPLQGSDLSCEDWSRCDCTFHVLRKALSDFFDEFSFVTVRIIA
jgi:hypothetical protein